TRWPRDWSSDVCSSDLGSRGTPKSARSSKRPGDGTRAIPAATPIGESAILARFVIFGWNRILLSLYFHHSFAPFPFDWLLADMRSEERRVGKECKAATS